MVPPVYRSLIAYLNTSALVYFSSNFPPQDSYLRFDEFWTVVRTIFWMIVCLKKLSNCIKVQWLNAFRICYSRHFKKIETTLFYMLYI